MNTVNRHYDVDKADRYVRTLDSEEDLTLG